MKDKNTSSNQNINSESIFENTRFWKIFGIVAGLVVDLGLTIFFFVISIIMIVYATQKITLDPRTFIGYLQANTTVYLCCFVIPLFVLLAINIILLVIYVKKTERKKVTVEELNDSQIDALKAELLNDLKKEQSDKKEDK